LNVLQLTNFQYLAPNVLPMLTEKCINVETVNRCAMLPSKGSADGAKLIQIAELNHRFPAHKR
jgi:hypothetical protein